jgi:hypothetical protein
LQNNAAKPEGTRATSPSTSASRPTAARLDFLRIPIGLTHAWTAGLLDYEVGWFFNLIFSSAAAEPQGYLVDTSDLWRVAGARRSDFFDRNKSGVLARFKSREGDGIKWLYFPPLLEILNRQSADLRKWRNRKTESPPLTHSLPDVAFEDQSQNLSECVPEKPEQKPEATKNAAADRQPTSRNRSIWP